MQLSHRASTILLVVLGLGALKVWSSGKLGRFWNALLSGDASSAAASSNTSGGDKGSSIKATPNQQALIGEYTGSLKHN